MKWRRVGDSCSAEFFRAAKAHSGASSITELEDSVGIVHTDQPALERLCSEYYFVLYKAEPPSLARTAATEQPMSTIRDRLSPSMKSALSAPISMGELDSAVKDLAVGKAPGPDGVIAVFFKLFWELIKFDYLTMINKAIADDKFPPGVTRGLISLLHKADVRRRLTNWRPITLLNVVYKLFAKVLQLRVQLVLMETISCDQSAFLPLRFILDNILLTHETLD